MTSFVKPLGATAIAALIAAAPLAGFAQSSAPATPPAAQSDGVAGDTMNNSSDMSADPGAMTTDTADATKPVDGTITMQSDDTILASNLMGAAVQTSNGDRIGDINNLIVNVDGKVEGVVIGVGGFLGMGEKDVALQMASLHVVTNDDNGKVHLQTDATKEQLKTAPEFTAKSELPKTGGSGAKPQDAAPPSSVDG